MELIRTESARADRSTLGRSGHPPPLARPETPVVRTAHGEFHRLQPDRHARTSPQLQDALALRGIFARECSNYRGLEIGSVVTEPGQEYHTRGHLRFCVRNPAENDLLVETLTDVMTSEAPSAPAKRFRPSSRFRRWRLRARR